MSRWGQALVGIALGLVCSASAIVYALSGNTIAWQRDLSLAVGSSALSVLLAVLLVDAGNRRVERHRESRVTYAAYRQLLTPLRRHLGLLQAMYKAALVAPPSCWPVGPSDFLASDIAAVLADLSLDRDAPVLIPGGSVAWLTHCGNEMHELRVAIDAVLTSYSHSLGSVDIDLLSSFRESELFDYVNAIQGILAIDQTNGWKRDYAMLRSVEALIGTHCGRILQTISRCNDVLGEPNQIVLEAAMWADNVAPMVGSGRCPARTAP